MFQSLYYQLGRVVVLRDGRISGYHQPEPEFLRRRYEHAQVLKELQREASVRESLERESQSFVDRIRVALRIA